MEAACRGMNEAIQMYQTPAILSTAESPTQNHMLERHGLHRHIIIATYTRSIKCREVANAFVVSSRVHHGGNSWKSSWNMMSGCGLLTRIELGNVLDLMSASSCSVLY